MLTEAHILLKQLTGKPVPSGPSGGASGKRLRENTPDRPITVPLLIAQGMSDDGVLAPPRT